MSFAWLKDVDSRIASTTMYGLSIRPDDVPSVIDHILRQEPPPWLGTLENRRILNSWMVNEVMATQIVIEQSPLDLETLSNILKSGIKGSATVALSVYVAASGDVMLFITVPSALLLIGAAKGTSKWLEQNIPKMLSKATRTWR